MHTTILLDIEGTTTPISFVTDVLFPYASKHVESYLRGHYAATRTQECIAEVRQQAREDMQKPDSQGSVEVPNDPQEAVIQAVLVNIKAAMQRDRKLTGLKKLQGHIWVNGYESGDLRAVYVRPSSCNPAALNFLISVYGDVVDAFRRWTTMRDPPLRIAIYSSGSIQAQKLLFGFSQHGDLAGFLSAYFDTTSGPKVEATSYSTIAKTLQESPSNIMFMTDNFKEAQAAKAAGMSALLLNRPGNAPFTDEQARVAPVIESFDEADRYLQGHGV